MSDDSQEVSVSAPTEDIKSKVRSERRSGRRDQRRNRRRNGSRTKTRKSSRRPNSRRASHHKKYSDGKIEISSGYFDDKNEDASTVMPQDDAQLTNVCDPHIARRPTHIAIDIPTLSNEERERLDEAHDVTVGQPSDDDTDDSIENAARKFGDCLMGIMESFILCVKTPFEPKEKSDDDLVDNVSAADSTDAVDSNDVVGAIKDENWNFFSTIKNLRRRRSSNFDDAENVVATSTVDTSAVDANTNDTSTVEADESSGPITMIRTTDATETTIVTSADMVVDEMDTVDSVDSVSTDEADAENAYDELMSEDSADGEDGEDGEDSEEDDRAEEASHISISESSEEPTDDTVFTTATNVTSSTIGSDIELLKHNLSVIASIEPGQKLYEDSYGKLSIDNSYALTRYVTGTSRVNTVERVCQTVKDASNCDDNEIADLVDQNVLNGIKNLMVTYQDPSVNETFNGAFESVPRVSFDSVVSDYEREISDTQE